ncbi:MAG: HDIG domain-containing protein [Patescibacteria group bacterium]|nr:HDIG domain-containing protein [Patescibacteria group bacterium]MDD5121073.1 HDIG domain-containing protein [Patescibacteria group bacterium]MDD5221565.1 HDIG domain-containing protein [Patescibacteria group bacterium]MDD5396008.1 HDIG domain-containing protein [Patescibacteria group bacterium]
MMRAEALKLVEEKIQNKNLIKHCLAVEAVMAALAQKFGQNKEQWALAGLLHDIDYEQTKDKPEQHSLIGAQMLTELNIDSEIIQAIKVHNDMHQLPRQTLIDKSLFCADPITGLIVASTLVLPNKKIIELTPENVLNRFKEKGFAKGANREHIAMCSEIALSLEEFVRISLGAMQAINNEIGL